MASFGSSTLVSLASPHSSYRQYRAQRLIPGHRLRGLCARPGRPGAFPIPRYHLFMFLTNGDREESVQLRPPGLRPIIVHKGAVRALDCPARRDEASAGVAIERIPPNGAGVFRPRPPNDGLTSADQKPIIGLTERRSANSRSVAQTVLLSGVKQRPRDYTDGRASPASLPGLWRGQRSGRLVIRS